KVQQVNGVWSTGEKTPLDEDSLVDEYLAKVFSRNADRPIFCDGVTDERITFGEALKRVKQLAAYLQKRGVQVGDEVVFCASNSVRSCIAFLALIFARAAVVSPKHSLTAYDLGQVLANMPSRVALVDATAVPKFRTVSETHPTLKTI